MCRLHFPGHLIFEWLMSLCNDCETQLKFLRSRELLIKFLSLPKTKKDIGQKAINATVGLLNSIYGKESKFAGYVRLAVKNCMNAMTTSPVEGHNSVIKKCIGLSRQLSLDAALSRLINYSMERLQERRRQATREKSQTNYASSPPTKYHLIRKGQALVDRNHDDRRCNKSAQISPRKWLVWNLN